MTDSAWMMSLGWDLLSGRPQPVAYSAAPRSTMGLMGSLTAGAKVTQVLGFGPAVAAKDDEDCMVLSCGRNPVFDSRGRLPPRIRR